MFIALRILLVLSWLLVLPPADVYTKNSDFVKVDKGKFSLRGHPYYFVGANYWYAGLIGNDSTRDRGIRRLRRELDFLKRHGVTNLRLLGGAEGLGLLNGVPRVGPSLQPQRGVFYEDVLIGLDITLAEMAKRDMKAVIFFSNNWEWSGGFQQYLIWNNKISEKWLADKPTWDELRDNVAKFYTCDECKADYLKQASLIIGRVNQINGRRYADDSTIMSWEIANEPRPMRPSSNEAYAEWLESVARLIKRLDKNHLVTTGHEGSIGTESVELFERVHRDANVDYLTIHIWPKNWGWFQNGKMAEGFGKGVEKTVNYIDESHAVAVRLDKPLVIEEFGLPRDNQSFELSAPTALRDRYFKTVISFVRSKPNIAGANFWAFAGSARPKSNQLFWKPGDEYTGDPPMEEQGLYSVFDSDKSTWRLIRQLAREKTVRSQ